MVEQDVLNFGPFRVSTGYLVIEETLSIFMLEPLKERRESLAITLSSTLNTMVFVLSSAMASP